MFEDKDYELNQEDFTEIDALLAAWSEEEADMPSELHQRIMGTLDSVSLKQITPLAKQKKSSNVYRYIAAAVLAAGVLLCSQAVGRIDLSSNWDYDRVKENNLLLAEYQETHFNNLSDYIADEATVEQNTVIMTVEAQNEAKSIDNVSTINYAASNMNDNLPLMMAGTPNLKTIDWQSESERMFALLKEEKTALFYAKDRVQKKEIQTKINWLDQCRHALVAQDEALYEALLSDSPYNE